MARNVSLRVGLCKCVCWQHNCSSYRSTCLQELAPLVRIKIQPVIRTEIPLPSEHTSP